jgi:HEAT repeat protein
VTHPIVERLGDRDPETRRRACLDAIDDPSAVILVDALADALADPVRRVARAASEALARIGKQHDAVAVALRRALSSDEPRRRWGAAFTSARLEPPRLGWLPALVEALGAEDAAVRWSSARLVVDTGRLHGEVLPVLMGLLAGDAAPRVRRMSIYCLRELAPDRPETADALLRATRDPDAGVRRAALTSLASVWDPAPGVAARLAEVSTRDPDPASRALAGRSLARLRGAQ